MIRYVTIELEQASESDETFLNYTAEEVLDLGHVVDDFVEGAPESDADATGVPQ